jgi:pimeloyl-ACP methyl ester carboxylesterase
VIVGSERLGGLGWVDHVFDVPLNHHEQRGETIQIFVREVIVAEHGAVTRPLLLYLQGGPGHAADRPLRSNGWLPRFLKEYRVLLLDQRGTGRSTPVDALDLEALGGTEEQASYLSNFRADSIVRDAEIVRRDLLGDQPWSILGQSFGGWCATTYLSHAPEGLREVFITGGLPSLTAGPDEVYRAAYPRLIEASRRYFAAFPGDRIRVEQLAEHIASSQVRLPRGERLTVRRFKTAGIALGLRDGFETMHFLIEQAFPFGLDQPAMTEGFIAALDQLISNAGEPLFCILHEPLYCQGEASRWSAHRIRDEFKEIDHGPDPSFFTGEMIYPWLFEEDPTLRRFADAANGLAERDDWPALYDEERLWSNNVPVYAAVYASDFFVDARMSAETAARIGNARIVISPEDHDALRTGGIADQLLGLREGDAL